MEAFRRSIDANPERFRRIAEGVKRRGYKLDGEEYKRPKKLRGDALIDGWYNRKRIGLEKSFDLGGDAFSQKLPEILVSAYAELMPMYEYFMEIYRACPETGRPAPRGGQAMQQNNKTPKTAVIMPAYNSGATIEASVRSILNQTVSNLVLIVVDDGSTDDTAAVLEKLRAEDERLIPMTVPNGGPAKARNLALDAVPEDAEYIMFADSDDLLESDALEYALTGRTGADLVLMGFSIKNTDGSTAAYYEAEQHLDPRRWARSLADYTRRTCSIRSGLSSSAPRWSKAVKSGSPTIAGARTGCSSLTALSAQGASPCCPNASTATSCTQDRAL